MMEDKPDVMLIQVAARIPEFWTDQPDLWFIQFEAVVAAQKASDEAQYQLLIAKLGKQVIQQVADILSKPPAVDKYKALKQRLLSVYEESENRRIQKLIGDMHLGDQKPSQLLRRMQNLAGTKVTVDALLVMWQNHLPVSVRSVLAATTLVDAEKLASVADKIMETSKTIEVSEVGPTLDTKGLAEELAKLRIEIAEIRESKGPKRSYFKPANRNRSRSRGRSEDKASTSSEKQKRFCYYHYRFAENATKCRQPCNWKKSLSGN